MLKREVIHSVERDIFKSFIKDELVNTFNFYSEFILKDEFFYLDDLLWTLHEYDCSVNGREGKKLKDMIIKSLQLCQYNSDIFDDLT